MEANVIRYGISGITKVGEEIVKQIISNRPYNSINDFLSKVKVNKAQMINLIKSGAFDGFGDRVELMHQYVNMISDTKKRVTLQNMKMLIDFKLLPNEFDFVCKVFNFNKYLKKQKLDNNYYGLDNIAFNFYSENFDIDMLLPAETESGFKVSQTKWDNIYQKHMDKVRPYIKKNQEQLLNAINNRLTSDVWNKYCLGNLSKWEMDAVSFYSHDHELAAADLSLYGLVDFFELSETPDIERIIPIKGKQVPIFKLYRIAGTVLDRDKAKKTVSLLTTTGVVTVKIFGGVFEQYDKQISVKGADGKKHIIEKSIFTRGNKIIITGIRQEDAFVAKTYSRTPYHKVEQIIGLEGSHLIIKSERTEVE
jgi:DNA polymerase-3 subunit alpha